MTTAAHIAQAISALAAYAALVLTIAGVAGHSKLEDN